MDYRKFEIASFRKVYINTTETTYKTQLELEQRGRGGVRGRETTEVHINTRKLRPKQMSAKFVGRKLNFFH